MPLIERRGAALGSEIEPVLRDRRCRGSGGTDWCENRAVRLVGSRSLQAGAAEPTVPRLVAVSALCIVPLLSE